MYVVSHGMLNHNSFAYYTPTHRVEAILQSPCQSVRPFTLS